MKSGKGCEVSGGRTFQVEGMAGAGMEVEVRTCKVYMWKAVWAGEGLHLMTGTRGWAYAVCVAEKRTERVSFSYSESQFL